MQDNPQEAYKTLEEIEASVAAGYIDLDEKADLLRWRAHGVLGEEQCYQWLQWKKTIKTRFKRRRTNPP